jgi:DNA replication protein DnaC
MKATATQLESRLSSLCGILKLPSVARNASRLAMESKRRGSDPLCFLVEMLELELEDRKERRAVRCTREAGFPLLKTLEGFDFRRAPDLPEPLIRELSEGSYIERVENILFLGEPGTGKSHLAIALGMAATRQGRRVRFVSAGNLATELVEARDARQLGRVIGRYSRVEILVVDELGYVPLSKTDAELLFQVFSERQERRPIILTSNLPFSEWTTVFKDARLCKALIDRLTHRAHIIDTGTNSVRLEEARKRPKDKKASRA